MNPFARKPWQPEPLPPRRTKQPACRRCGQPILFVEMAKSGNLMPCDPGWAIGDGRKTLVVQDAQLKGRMLVKAEPGLRGREVHWGSCPARQHARLDTTHRNHHEELR